MKTAGDNPITISASELGLSGTGTITVSKLDDFRIKEEFITNMAEASSGTEQPITASAVYNYLVNGTSAAASLSTQTSVSVVKNGTGLTFNFSIQQGPQGLQGDSLSIHDDGLIFIGSNSTSYQFYKETYSATAIAGENAAVTLSAVTTGDERSLTWNFVLPKGDTGAKGDKGDQGYSIAAINISGTYNPDSGAQNIYTVCTGSGQIGTFCINNGAKGDSFNINNETGQMQSGTTGLDYYIYKETYSAVANQLASDCAATVSLGQVTTGDARSITWTFGIPQGAKGDTGATGPKGDVGPIGIGISN